MTPHRILSLQEAATRAGVSIRTLYRWIGEHRLPTIDNGGRPTIDEAQLERYLDGGRPKRERNVAGARDVAQHILAAAAAVASREGAAAITLERVAQEAGLTLGGVAYHYRSRQALHEALVERFVEAVEAAWREGEAQGMSVVDAYVATSTGGDGPSNGDRALVALVLSSPPLRKLADARVRRWYRRIRAAGGPDAVQRCLAADAVWLFGMIGISPIPRRMGAGAKRRVR